MLRKNILVFDRDRDICKCIQEFLKDEYNVFPVQNGDDILSALERDNIHLVLTDIDLPNTHVYNFINQLHEAAPQIPIIMMYVYCDCTQEVEDVIRKMASAIFLKPFDLRELKKKIDLLLSKRTRLLAK
jgi:DNA-binding NtrC family response regulator